MPRYTREEAIRRGYKWQCYDCEVVFKEIPYASVAGYPGFAEIPRCPECEGEIILPIPGANEGNGTCTV